MPYQHSTHTLTTTTEPMSLFWQKWLPAGMVDRVLVFQHGMGEHAGRYQHLLDALAHTGTALYASDARGHGRTKGRRGYVARFGQFADDLNDLVQLARSENDHQKVILLGHSMGGAIVLDYALRTGSQENLRGLVLSSPAIEVPADMKNRVLKATAGLLTRLAPNAVLDTMLSQAAISHDADTVAAYRTDPLVHSKASVLLGHALFHVSKRFYSEADKLTIPVYLFHGTADTLTSPEGSRKFFEKLTTADKTLNLYEGLYHETMNELPADRKLVLADLVAWLVTH